MSGKSTELDKAYIERKRAQLLKLRAELLGADQDKVTEEADINATSSDTAQEYEDDAQRLTMLELDGTMAAHDRQRLAQVDRALQKIKEGTYGLSDASGKPIPVERLDAMPDALYTVAEQSARDK
jgi:DnaK suppressor protein